MKNKIVSPFTSKEMEEKYALEQFEKRIKKEVRIMKMYRITYTKEVTSNEFVSSIQVVGIQYIASKRQALAIVEHYNSKRNHKAEIVELHLPEPKNVDFNEGV